MNKKYLINCDKQEKIILDAYNSNKLHHAYLFYGIDGIGKSLFAQKIARFLLNNKDKKVESLDLVDEDKVCDKIKNGGFLDYKFIDFEVKNGIISKEIKVDQIREVNKMFFTTHSAENYRVIIINEAQTLNKSAANAFLKNLEEPSENTIFFLITNNLHKMLPTIRSRCFLMGFDAVSYTDLKEIIQKQNTEFDINNFDEVYKYSQGSIGKATEFINNYGIVEQMKIILSLVKNNNRVDVFQFIKKINEEGKLHFVFNFLLSLIKSEALYKKYLKEVNEVDIIYNDKETLLLLMIEEVAGAY